MKGMEAAVRVNGAALKRRRNSRRLDYLLDSNTLDALSQEGDGLSEEPVQQQSGGGGIVGRGTSWAPPLTTGKKRRVKKKKGRGRRKMEDATAGEDIDGGSSDNEENENGGGSGGIRQREHPFIVTEPGEVGRGKRTVWFIFFHLFEQCHEFLIQVQIIDGGDDEDGGNEEMDKLFGFNLGIIEK